MNETLIALADAMAPEHLFLTRVALAALLLFFALSGGRLFRRAVAALGRRRRVPLPESVRALLAGFVKPVELFLRLVCFYWAALLAPLPESWTHAIWNALTPLLRAAAVFLAAWGFWRAAPLCRRLLSSAEDRLDIHTNQTIGRFFENIYRVLVAGFALLTVLEMLGVPVASLIAGAGLVGLAVSLAAQSTLGNLIAGITLVVERPFAIGDFIILGEFYGTVEDISFRSTRLRTPDNVVVTVENVKVCSEYIQNGTERDSRLWSFTLRLPYDAPLERVDALAARLKSLFEDDPDIRPDPTVTVDEIGEDGVKLLVRAYTATADYAAYLNIRDKLNRRALALVEEEGLRLCYPPASVYAAPRA